MQDTDPREILAHNPMKPMQIVAVAVCILLNALDGFDVLAISFAAPGISSDWNVDRAALGIILSMELVGMSLGAILLGMVADRIGRRPVLLGCLVVMAAGMALASRATGISDLLVYRFFTGLGIGGLLAAINAMSAEVASARAKNLCVALMAAGYPAGAVIGGSIASSMLVDGSWRDIFIFGAIVTAAVIPLMWFLLPESVGYLAERQPRNALERINRTMRRFSHAEVAALPPVETGRPRLPLAQLLGGQFRMTTILLTLIYFAHIMTFYFLVKWIPKIVTDMGYEPSAAGGVLVWTNVGGLIGGLVFSVLTWRFQVKGLLFAVLIGSALFVVLFGQGSRDLAQLSLMTAAAGFFITGGVIGIYAAIAAAYPASVRAGGTGFVIGLGRGGAVVGPIAAGFLLSIGFGLPVVALVMAAGSFIAALALLFLRPATAQPG